MKHPSGGQEGQSQEGGTHDTGCNQLRLQENYSDPKLEISLDLGKSEDTKWTMKTGRTGVMEAGLEAHEKRGHVKCVPCKGLHRWMRFMLNGLD